MLSSIDLDFQKIKKKIYYVDGSLRDIYIHNTSKEDWQVWADFVNENYKISFHIYETKVNEDKVNLSKIFDYWCGVHDNCSTATIYIGDIQVNAHFFDDQEIENDISPKEIKSIEDHNQLLGYMVGLSNVLNKKVIMTPENEPNMILISVDKGKIFIKN
jgi:hypothetical protein